MQRKVTKGPSIHPGCLRDAIAVERHHDHGNSYNRKHLIELVAYSSEVQSIITMVGHSSVQADMVLEK